MGKREHENILLEFSIAMSKIGLDERGEQRSNETTQIPPIPEKRRKNFYWLKTLLTKEIRSAVANPGAEAAALGVAMAEKRVVTAARAEEMGELKNVLVAAYSTFANIEMQMNRMNQTKMHLKIGFPKLKRRFWSRLLMLFKSVSKSTLLVEFYVPDKNAFEPIFEILFKISNV